MRLARLDVAFDDLADLADVTALVAPDEGPVVLRVRDADTATVVAGVGARWPGSAVAALSGSASGSASGTPSQTWPGSSSGSRSWGVWLEASDDYSAALIARDVKTLAALVSLGHVVIDAAAHAGAHAEVVAALLSDDEVNLRNEVAHLTHAYNRPAPARALVVWHVEGDTLVHGAQVLRRTATRGAVTLFED